MGRGKVAITHRGKEILAGKPDRVDVDYLRQFPEFEEFRTKTRVRNTPSAVRTPLDPDANPEELLYSTYESLRQAVEVDVLDRLQSDALSWEFFEQVVVDVLSRMGFGSNVEETGRRVTRRSGDDGIDGVVDEDRLGLDAIHIQAKHGVGVRTRRTLDVKRVDEAYFKGDL